MNTENKTVFYITDNGLTLAEKLKALYPGIRIMRYSTEELANSWKTEKNLVFIMASGIVVRGIAPMIENKLTDPGVVVLDEKGLFSVSLLGGHMGGANRLAGEIAEFLGGMPVITTASDVNNMPALDLWAEEQGLIIENRALLAHSGTKLLNSGNLMVYTEIDAGLLPEAFIITDDHTKADVLITNRKDITRDAQQLYLRPGNLVIGVGCNSGTSAAEIEGAVGKVFNEQNLSLLSACALATINLKASEPGLLDFAAKHGLNIVTFSPDELNEIEGPEKSETVFKATGAHAVSEAAALIASGLGRLVVRKQKLGNVTLAVAEKNLQGAAGAQPRPEASSISGKIFVVGTGPGRLEHITQRALEAIEKSQAIVGYGTYLDLITDLIRNKEVISTGMTQEIDRCKAAVDLARSGKTVAVVSGGDPGIYAMAGLVLEIIKTQEASAYGNGGTPHISVEVVPGISALNAGASRLGAPLMHDFAVISLSDRLTPWETIEKRLKAAAAADFVIVLYNPKSMGRPDHIDKARAICLGSRSAETPVGLVKAAMRENEKVVITNLRDMLNHDIDMQTTVFIGNSSTFAWKDMMITPRGYAASGERADRKGAQ